MIDSDTIYVVTGIPRSGTSLMMQILEKLGCKIQQDNVRTADVSNPNGYYEYTPVKGIFKNNGFLAECKGKVVKIVTPLPVYLDLKYTYKVIFMRREIDEILMSQEKMLGKDQSAEREKFKLIYTKHIDQTKNFFEKNAVDYLEVNYNQLLQNSDVELNALLPFLGIDSTNNTIREVINPELYRNKA